MPREWTAHPIRLDTKRAGNQQAMDQFVSVNAGSLSPEAFFEPGNLQRVLGAPAV
jgi:hypothetical protein